MKESCSPLDSGHSPEEAAAPSIGAATRVILLTLIALSVVGHLLISSQNGICGAALDPIFGMTQAACIFLIGWCFYLLWKYSEPKNHSLLLRRRRRKRRQVRA